jgi:hypothetical protein
LNPQQLVWQNLGGVPSKSYICGYCGNDIAENRGYTGSVPGRTGSVLIYICHYCSSPTYFDASGSQWPGSSFGQNVGDLPVDGVAELYGEARRCISSTSYTASVLCSRKLKFIEYVDYLAAKGYIPPDGKEWVDYIRTKGNEATHEIALMQKEDAERLVTFLEMLLKFVFEFPALAKKTKPIQP